jgi:glucokinase
MINAFSPRKVVTGGVWGAGGFFIEKIAGYAMRRAMPACSCATSIVGAALGNRAGCYGAAAQGKRILI